MMLAKQSNVAASVLIDGDNDFAVDSSIPSVQTVYRFKSMMTV